MSHHEQKALYRKVNSKARHVDGGTTSNRPASRVGCASALEPAQEVEVANSIVGHSRNEWIDFLLVVVIRHQVSCTRRPGIIRSMLRLLLLIGIALGAQSMNVAHAEEAAPEQQRGFVSEMPGQYLLGTVVGGLVVVEMPPLEMLPLEMPDVQGLSCLLEGVDYEILCTPYGSTHDRAFQRMIRQHDMERAESQRRRHFARTLLAPNPPPLHRQSW